MAWIVLVAVTVVGVVVAVLGFVLSAQANSYNSFGSGLMQVGISLAIIPLGTVLLRRAIVRRGERRG